MCACPLHYLPFGNGNPSRILSDSHAANSVRYANSADQPFSVQLNLNGVPTAVLRAAQPKYHRK